MKPYTSSKPIRLVLADVDGTLVTKDKVLTERAKKAVHALHDKGILFAITSGRPPFGMKMLIDPLQLQTPVAGFNGGVYTKPDLSIITERKLSREAATTAIRIIEQHGLTAWIYTADNWYVPDMKGPHVDREGWTVKKPALPLTDLEALLPGVVKIVGVSDALETVGEAEAACQAALAGKASAQRSQPYYLDVTHPQANKGAVAEYLALYYKFSLEEIAVLGDMPNDVPMFLKAGMSIAMGQASPQVKEQANFVTAGYEDEGFAKAIEEHLLSDK